MAVLYATVEQLQQELTGLDTSGTPATLTPAQLTQALKAASDRVSVFAGNVYDGSNPQATPPDIFADLTLDLACFWAFKYLLKSKEMSANHPVMLAYKDAMQILIDVRDGKIRLDVVPPGGIGQETGHIINRIPNIFTFEDSNTRYNPVSGYLEADTPDDQWSLNWNSAVYQG